MSRCLVISDTHFPFVHPQFLEFCVDVYNKWICDSVVHIGDVTDNHMCSRHAKHMRAMGMYDECEAASENIQQWYETFPKALVCIGNHDERPARLAAENFMPERFMKSYSDAWVTPGWKWDYEHVLDGVRYIHGIGCSGKYAALTVALANGQSTVLGHVHTFPGVQWNASSEQAWFGMNVGCGFDPDTYAAAYGRHFKHKPVLGCGVVLDGEDAYFIKMDLGRKCKATRRGRYSSWCSISSSEASAA